MMEEMPVDMPPLSQADLDALIARDRSEQFHMLLGFWLGAVIYGLYLILFGLSIRITWKNRSRVWSSSSKVFLVGTVIILVLTTIYMGINTRRFLHAFTPDVATIREGWPPVYYLRNYSTWDGFGVTVIMDILVWLADGLVIYRCFLIWGGNWWIIVVPTLLLGLSIASGTIILVFFKHPAILPWNMLQLMPLFDMTYPVNLTQSLLTTGLIVFKLGRQHMISRAAGLVVGGAGVGLLTIIRIVVESAMIFAFQHLMLMILYMTDSPAQLVFHGTLVPSIGVVFVLIALRAYAAQNETVSIRFPQTSTTGSRSTAQPPSTGSIAHYQNNRSLSGGLVLTSAAEPTRHARSPSTHIVTMQTTPGMSDKLEVDIEKGFSPGDSSADVGLGAGLEIGKVESRHYDSSHVRDAEKQG